MPGQVSFQSSRGGIPKFHRLILVSGRNGLAIRAKHRCVNGPHIHGDGGLLLAGLGTPYFQGLIASGENRLSIGTEIHRQYELR